MPHRAARQSVESLATWVPHIRQALIIVDRIGTTIDIIPQLFATTNGRPTGQAGAFLQFRTGSEVVNIAAARLLDVPTAA